MDQTDDVNGVFIHQEGRIHLFTVYGIKASHNETTTIKNVIE